MYRRGSGIVTKPNLGSNSDSPLRASKQKFAECVQNVTFSDRYDVAGGASCPTKKEKYTYFIFVYLQMYFTCVLCTQSISRFPLVLEDYNE